MLPELFLERMKSMLGEEFPAFERSMGGERFRALRVNTRKTTTEEFLGKVSYSLKPVPWTENGYYYEAGEQPGKHPFHAAGVYYIQEPSAMAPAPFLEAQPGERVLDLCAAPGGKSTQLADAMGGEGILIANEIHPARAKILSENIERMGVTNAIVMNESPERLSVAFPGYFDRILVDAPCSGEGMFRKSGEATEEWSAENVALCAKRQDEILECAAGMLRPGGRLVYSTCTFAPAEDEGSVSRFLALHPEFSIVKVKFPESFRAGVGKWVDHPSPDIAHTARLMPHLLRGEGHYLAVLEKTANEKWDGRRNSPGGLEKGVAEKECREYLDFCRDYLIDWKKDGVFLRFGEQLYLAPPQTPSLKGLKVLRAGLHLGTVKKNRFEPSHAWALALSTSQVRQSAALKSNERAVEMYLEGLSFPTGNGGLDVGLSPEAKGWCLVCVDGYSLGWGKMANGMLKNHYPKGLRI